MARHELCAGSQFIDCCFFLYKQLQPVASLKNQQTWEPGRQYNTSTACCLLYKLNLRISERNRCGGKASTPWRGAVVARRRRVGRHGPVARSCHGRGVAFDQSVLASLSAAPAPAVPVDAILSALDAFPTEAVVHVRYFFRILGAFVERVGRWTTAGEKPAPCDNKVAAVDPRDRVRVDVGVRRRSCRRGHGTRAFDSRSDRLGRNHSCPRRPERSPGHVSPPCGRVVVACPAREASLHPIAAAWQGPGSRQGAAAVRRKRSAAGGVAGALRLGPGHRSFEARADCRPSMELPSLYKRHPKNKHRRWKPGAGDGGGFRGISGVITRGTVPLFCCDRDTVPFLLLV